MTADEFADWIAYYQLEPFGSTADDVRFGTLASASIAPWGGKTAPGEWFTWNAKIEAAWGTWRDLKAAMGGVPAPVADARDVGVIGPELLADKSQEVDSGKD